MGGYTLIVDDEPVMAELLAVTLKAAGVTTQVALDGDEALARIACDPPDLILLDLMMPRLSGFEVLARLKRDPVTAHIPVVVISAFVSREDDARLVEAACVMPKGSFGALEIRQAVASLLGQSG